MKNHEKSLFTQTVLKILKVTIFLSEDGIPRVSIKLHPSVDAISLIQGVILKFSNDNEVILEAGIATLLHKAMLSLSEAMYEAKEKCIFTIPLEKKIPIMDSTTIKIYMVDNGRVVSKKFEFQ